MTKIDTNVKNLIINELTQEQYNAALQSGEINENELYMVIDETYPTMDDLTNSFQPLINSSNKLPAANISGLANVATTGEYSDLLNTPTIPDAQVQSDWNAVSGMGVILNKPTLATVATSGSYNDLTDKPTIPVVDSTYNASSTNAQSGTAVAEAIAEVSVATDNNTINKNSSDELQALGVINPQTDTAMRIWEGTESEYNSGGSVTFYNWQSGGWQPKTSGVSSILYSIAYGNGKYVTVGASGTILVSTNEGATWTSETSGVSYNLNAVTYGNGVFVAVGASGTVVISSGDGTWTKKSRLGDNMRAVAYGNGMFMATDNDGHCCVSTDDGDTWSTYSEVLPEVNASGLVYNPDDEKFYCVCGQRIYTSTNGQSWTQVASVNGSRIAYGSNKLVVVGDSGAIYGSTDFTNWTAETSGVSGTLTGVTYANDKFYAVGAGETILSSTGDGTWTIEHTGTTLLYSMAYGQNYVVVGASGTVLTSDGNPVLSVYTIDQNPTTESTVYSDTTTQSALTITAVGTGAITLSDTNTYDYNASGNQTTTQNIGQAHPDWLCNIEGVGVKKGTTLIANKVLVDQTFNASSTNAQSGTAVAEAISSVSIATDNDTINKNSSDELQALGVINPQSEEPIRIWEGTQAEWEHADDMVTLYDWYNSSLPKHYYTEDGNLDVSSSSQLYERINNVFYPTDQITVVSKGSGTVTLSDGNTYDFDGTCTTYGSVGLAHPDWLCNIEDVGVKVGNTLIAEKNSTVDQTYDSTSINAQSGIAVAEAISSISIATDNTTINKNSSDELQAIGVQDARTDTAIRLWSGTEAQYNNGGSTIFYNWQSGGLVVTNTGITFTPKAIAYGNGKYIAVGTGGAIYSSTNKTTWTQETSGVSVDLNGIAYGNSKFIAVGNSGTIISSSGNGTWTQEISNTSGKLTGICFGNNTFVTSGRGLYSSGDGTWTANNYNYSPIVFANGYFYYAEFDTRHMEDYQMPVSIYKSSDGISFSFSKLIGWMDEDDPQIYYMSGAGNVVYFEDQKENFKKYSIDGGTTWNNFNGSIPVSVVYSNNIYYAQIDGILESSSDGITYTSIGSASGISYLCYGDALVGVGGSSTLNVMTYGSAINAYTTDQNPTTSSRLYSEPNVISALTITAVGTGTITLSDGNTYDYNSSGNQTVSQTVGQAHPDWLCNIENIGIKKGDSLYAEKNNTVDQIFNASSTNAQSGTAVKSAIDNAISSVYKPAGSSTFANLPTPASTNEGNVYNMSEEFTTDSRFVEGSGNTYPAGTNVVIIDAGSSTYKFDVLSGFIDLSGYATTASLANVATTGEYSDLLNKPTIPTTVVELSDSSNYLNISDTIQFTMENISLANVATTGEYSDLLNTPTIPDAQVQSDWNAVSGMGVILNKPTIPVVDSTYNASSTNAQSGVAVKSAIDNAISSVYKPAGSSTFANLPTPSSSNEGNVYNMSEEFTTDSRFVEGTGKTYPAGTNVVIINTSGTTYKFDVLSGFIDLSPYATTASLANVATSGSYNDLSNTPGTATYYDLGLVKPDGRTITITANGTISASGSGVTLDTDQDITGIKTFVGEKRIKFKQTADNTKLGFTLYNFNNAEVGYLEYNPSTSNMVNSTRIMTLGNYITSAANRTYVGFRYYDGTESAAYNLLAPLAKDAKTDFNLSTTYTHFYIPLGFKNGNTMVKAGSNGVVDLSTLMPAAQVQSDWDAVSGMGVILNKPTLATVATSGSYNDLTDKPTIPVVDQTYNASSANAQSGVAIEGMMTAKFQVVDELPANPQSGVFYFIKESQS